MRVLLIEDDPRIARDLRQALEREGYLVEHSSDGEDGWFRGDTEDFAAVVLDLGLPGLDGLSIVKEIAEVYALEIAVANRTPSGLLVEIIFPTIAKGGAD